MPQKTVKNKSGRRVFMVPGSPVPMTLSRNETRKITYKVPLGLLEPQNILKAKQKDKANDLRKKEDETRQRKLAQEKFAAMLRADREKIASQPVSLLKAFENNEKGFKPSLKTSTPGSTSRVFPPNLLRMMRGEPSSKPTPAKPSINAILSAASSGKTIRKANLLKLERTMQKTSGNKPTGKFWNKKSNSSNNNSD